MALQGNGQLLVKVSGQPFQTLMSTMSGPSAALTVPGFTLELLSPAPQARLQTRLALSAMMPANHWLLAKPDTAAPDNSPWDTAHAAAKAGGYAHYVEPDIIHTRPVPPAPAMLQSEAAPVSLPEKPPNPHFPPYVKPNVGISPGWHLGPDFTGFQKVRDRATGKGIRIAHPDTGFTPGHASKPRNLRPDLGYDYWDNKPGAVDPQTGGPLTNAGHGTATLALLAGNTMDLTFGEYAYAGDIGGAPDAEVVPIRIGPSVIHICTSSMAKGLLDALGPTGDPQRSDPANRCDIVSLSHGGLPSSAWADAVNTLYEDGIIVVAASGDSLYYEVIDIATRYTVYPSAFNRVITALGATYEQLPYKTNFVGEMQGCWGPDSVMAKAVAAYTPNVVWMDCKNTPDGYSMDGGGTSSSTPQIAAACALWLQLYGQGLGFEPRRVEACRLALFTSAANPHPDKPELGYGILDVQKMLDPALAAKVIAKVNSSDFRPSFEDSVSFPLWRLLTGLGPPGSSAEEKMYENEVAQVVTQSSNNDLLAAARQAAAGTPATAADISKAKALISEETISAALRKRIGT